MIMMLFHGALRIQDIIGPTFKELKDLRPNEHGYRVMHFFAKKTTSRDVSFNKATYDAVISHQKSSKLADEQAIFEPGEQDNPA